MAKLNPRQRAFAEYYIKLGNAEQAAIKAGYSERTARGHSHRMLQNVAITDYIKEKNKEIQSERIADMTEVKAFWSDLLRDEEADVRDRLKASEYIAKTNAAFVDNVKNEHSGGVNIILEGDVKEWAK